MFKSDSDLKTIVLMITLKLLLIRNLAQRIYYDFNDNHDKLNSD